MGATRIIAVDHVPARMKMSRRLGADEVLDGGAEQDSPGTSQTSWGSSTPVATATRSWVRGVGQTAPGAGGG